MSKTVTKTNNAMQALDKELAKALTKTLAAYERLFADPKGQIKRWEDYGHSYSCRICKVMGSQLAFDALQSSRDCKACPLGSENSSHGCGESNNSLWAHSRSTTRMDLMNKIWEYEATPNRDNLRAVVRAAKVRYKSILKVLDDNGWEYK